MSGALWLIGALLALFPASGSDTIVLKAATVLPVTGPPLSPGFVTIEGDRILQVGGLAPEGLAVRDLGGAWITPGFLDAGWRAFVTQRSDGDSHPEWLWGDVLDREFDPRRAWAGGVTSAVAVPATQQAIAGWAPLVRFTPKGITVSRSRALLFGSVSTSLENRSEIHELLLAGARAKEEWDRYLREREAYRRADAEGRAADGPPRLPESDPALTSLADVLTGVRPMRLGISDWSGWRRLSEAPELSEVRFWFAGEVEPPVDTEVRERAMFVLAPRTLKRLTRSASSEASDWLAAGWSLAFASDDIEDPAFLRFEAARAIARGAPRDDVLAALTIVPARELGLAGELGSLSPGTLADLVIWSGDPFDPTTKVSGVVLGGKLERISKD